MRQPWLACCEIVPMIWNTTSPSGDALGKMSPFWWKSTMARTSPLPRLFFSIPVTVFIALRQFYREAELVDVMPKPRTPAAPGLLLC
jgi:hypothetical protein